MKRNKELWCVAGCWKLDQSVPIQQVYGPFETQALAKLFKRSVADPDWVWEVFALLGSEWRITP